MITNCLLILISGTVSDFKLEILYILQSAKFYARIKELKLFLKSLKRFLMGLVRLCPDFWGSAVMHIIKLNKIFFANMKDFDSMFHRFIYTMRIP